ncbi:MAG: type II toxin-antitoxin system RelE/ParE family toxin [Gemmatimonadetes bacterium]|nr:type II toxin-antitoxin system RelE/ParE family toxin [Gemmatimonadota bacterium]
MSYALVYTARARRDLKKLDVQTAARIVVALERFAATGHGDVKKLTDVHPPEYRLRVGDHRVRFQRDDTAELLIVLRVLPRGEAY